VAQRVSSVARERRRLWWPGTRGADAAVGGRCRVGVGAGKPADRKGLGWRPGWWVWRAALRCPVHRSADWLGRWSGPVAGAARKSHLPPAAGVGRAARAGVE